MTRPIRLMILMLLAAGPVLPAAGATDSGAAPVALVPPLFATLTIDPAARRTTMTGTAEPNARVEVLDGGRLIATTTSNAAGMFSAVISRALESGRHEFTLRATSSGSQLLPDARLVVTVPANGTEPVTVALAETNGTGTAVGPVPLSGSTANPATVLPPPSPRTVVVKDGDTLWTIAEAALGDGDLWPSIYEANRRLIPNPRFIYAGQILTLPASGIATATPGGN